MEGSLKKRGKYWYLTVDIGKEEIGIDESGKPIYKRIRKKINTKCEKKPDAQKVQLEILNQLKNNTFVNPEKILFSDFLKDWLENYVKVNCEFTTYQCYKLVLDTHIIPYFREKSILLQKLQPMDIQKYYTFLMEKGNHRTGEGLSGNTVIKHHGNIHKCLDYALKMQLVSRNVADAVQLPKKEKFKASFYSEKDIKKLINAVKGTSIEVPVIITIMLGLRRGEVLGLKWSNVNLKEKTLFIVETRTRFVKEVTKSTKNESSTRTMPIPDELLVYLKQVRKRQAEQRLLCGDSYCNDDYVCCWEDGKPLTPDYLSKKFKRVLDYNGLPMIRFHDLRHSNASYLLKKGVSMKEIQEWLGHKQLSTTADIYSHVDLELKKQSAKKVNNLLKLSM